ncbi:MAG TPA: GNAT family N-acetyltransferase [Anaerolineales bacterium]|nr:GNAT family N-acetyltransferase [Anaerolineales bacterium]
MIVRQAAYADKPAIFEFLDSAYAGRSEFKYPHRWEWAYERNPFLDGDAPPVWIAVAPDGRVIGQSAALIEPLVVDGEEYRAGWGVDFHVLAEYRGQGIGKQLQAANDAGNEVFMSLSMADAAAAIKRGLGLEPLPEVGVFTRILHHDPGSVRETIIRRFPWLPSAVAAGLSRPAARLLTRRSEPRRSAPPPNLQVRREPHFSEAYDRLWARLGGEYRALIRRDARYLTWKFKHQPHMQHEILGGYRDGNLSGYAILRRTRPPERDAGVLVDLFTDPTDRAVTTLLIDAVLRRFWELEAAYVTAASGAPHVRRSLTEAGFKQTKTVTPLARAPFPLPGEGWLLGKGDQDWDQVPLA